MLYKFTYEDSELDYKDLIIRYVERGCDEVKEFTIENFVPDDYVLSVKGDEEFELTDYYPQDWFNDNVTERYLKELVKEYEIGIQFASHISLCPGVYIRKRRRTLG